MIELFSSSASGSKMTPRWFIGTVWCLALVVLWGCSGGDGEPPVDDWEPPEGTSMRFDPAGTDFFDVPFPDDVRTDGGNFEAVFSSWPGAEARELTRLWFSTADRLLDGWGLSGAVFAYFSDPIDASTLPEDADASVDFDGEIPSVFLVDVDPDSEHRGEVFPITCQFREAPGSYHPEHQLGCISPFGMVRRPNTTYALVVTDRVLDTEGDPVVPDEPMARLLRGEELSLDDATVDPAGYEAVLDTVETLGAEPDSVTSAVLFTTGDPSERLRTVAQWYRELPTPEFDPDPGLTVVDTYEEFAVVEGRYDVPVIQQGARPYASPPEGRIIFDDQDAPTMVDEQTIRFYLTIPRSAAGDDGYPALLYLHGSGGRAEQLMHRGARPDEDVPPPEGTGPGGVVAEYGIAGFAADFNLHGMRHDPPDTTGLQFYNLLSNPAATVDNFLIGAAEIGLHARLLEAMDVDIDRVDGLREVMPEEAGRIHFDAEAFAAMGQSMGSTIGLPGLTVDSTIDAGVFSGAGGLLITVALEATEPIPVGDTLQVVLGYADEEPFDRYDPVLNAIQHVWDLVDPVAHGPFLVDEPHDGIEPTHALQHSGLEDGYFSPESRAGFSTAMGAELVEPVYEPEAFELMRWRGFGDPLELPAGANRDGTTALVAQYEPRVLDGHHVAFQRDDAKAQYACFVHSLTTGGAPLFRSSSASEADACLEQ